MHLAQALVGTDPNVTNTQSEGSPSGFTDQMIASEYVPLNVLGSPSNYLPLLKTSGADGQTPVFFDMSTPSGVQEAIAAVDAGNFYMAALCFGPEFNTLGVMYQYTWWWAGSLTRS